MNNQDKGFWSEFPEDELKDPANRRVLAVLQDVYRVDEDDQRSVQRAWTRIAANMEQRQQKKQQISRLDTLHDSSVSFFLSSVENSTGIQHRQKRRRRIDTLVALGIIFLLIGSMLGVIALHNVGSSKEAGPRTPIATQKPDKPITSSIPATTPSLVALGTTLGPFSLRENLSALQKNPEWSCTSIKERSSLSFMYYQCLNGLYINFVYNSSINAWLIQQLIATEPFPGMTGEGFGLGMSLDQFTRIYQKFHESTPIAISSSSRELTYIDSYDGTMIRVLFNQYNLAMQITLQWVPLNK